MKPITSRLVRLEDRMRPAPCPACRGWGESAHEVTTASGEVRVPARPDTCPRCGRLVPIRLHRRYVIDDSDNDAA